MIHHDVHYKSKFWNNKLKWNSNLCYIQDNNNKLEKTQSDLESPSVTLEPGFKNKILWRPTLYYILIHIGAVHGLASTKSLVGLTFSKLKFERLLEKF